MKSRISTLVVAAAAALTWGASATAHAQEKFTFLTNWYAIAEHGGFYQALTQGLYKKAGLDVTVKMGGPRSTACRSWPPARPTATSASTCRP